jgi:hypothetical protein
MKKASITAIIFLSLISVRAQKFFPVVVGENGFRVSQIMEMSDTLNPITDSLAVSEARRFTALNAMCVKKQSVERINVVSFRMVHVHDTDTVIIEGNSEKLNNLMKCQLNNLQSGDRLNFENIIARLKDEDFLILPAMFVVF